MDHLAKLFEIKDGANRDVVQQKAAEMQRSKQISGTEFIDPFIRVN